MASVIENPAWPDTLTTDQVAEHVAHDAYVAMRLRKIKRAGTRLSLPLEGGSEVSYFFDGLGYWHRAGTKAAQAVQRDAGLVKGQG